MYIDGEEVFNKAFPVVTSLLRGAAPHTAERPKGAEPGTLAILL
jgi:hypothetical protein